MYVLRFLCLLIFVLNIASCGLAEKNTPPDVSNITAPLELVRFDRAVLAMDSNRVEAELARMDDEYGAFSDIYFRHITPIRRGDFSPEEQIEVVKAFLRYQPLRRLDSLVASRFDDAKLEGHRRDLQQALKYYHYYLPDAPLPDTLTTFLSEFSFAGLLYGNGDLAAGLEFYLGPEFDYTQVNAQEAIFSQYLTQTYRPEYLTAKLMRVLIDDYAPRPRAGRLIDHIVYEGKKLYLLERVLPEAPAEVLLETSPEKVAWLEENEISIYAHLQEEDQFYSTAPNLIRQLTQPAPYTPGMPKESPGQAVNYLGKRIVEAYVDAHPEVTMAELLGMQDGQAVLAGARFKPRG